MNKKRKAVIGLLVAAGIGGCATGDLSGKASGEVEYQSQTQVIELEPLEEDEEENENDR